MSTSAEAADESTCLIQDCCCHVQKHYTVYDVQDVWWHVDISMVTIDISFHH